MQNALKILPQTMLSTEIAELTGKDKSHVHRDIQVQLLKGLYGLDNPDLDNTDLKGISSVKESRGFVSYYELDKEHTMTLISGYDVKLRHRITQRWLELEETKPMSQLDILAGQIQIMQEQERKLNKTVEDVKQLESKVETMQIDLRNGVPFGCIAKKNAWNVYCPSLGYETFKQVMEHFKVETQNYVHHAEGFSTPTYAYVESQIKTAINKFIEDLTQETKCFCHSNFLNKRVKYLKA
jgi:hypothetical protein